MEYPSLSLLFFKLTWSLEINGKYVLVRIADRPNNLLNEEISRSKGNNITMSRTITNQRKQSQDSALFPQYEVFPIQMPGPRKKLEYHIHFNTMIAFYNIMT